MKIIKTYNWNRRDFFYDAECEGCQYVSKKQSGYDDYNYYNNVIPRKPCTKCGETSESLNKGQLPVILPRYNPNLIL